MLPVEESTPCIENGEAAEPYLHCTFVRRSLTCSFHGDVILLKGGGLWVLIVLPQPVYLAFAFAHWRSSDIWCCWAANSTMAVTQIKNHSVQVSAMCR